MQSVVVTLTKSLECKYYIKVTNWWLSKQTTNLAILATSADSVQMHKDDIIETGVRKYIRQLRRSVKLAKNCKTGLIRGSFIFANIHESSCSQTPNSREIIDDSANKCSSGNSRNISLSKVSSIKTCQVDIIQYEVDTWFYGPVQHNSHKGRRYLPYQKTTVVLLYDNRAHCCHCKCKSLRFQTFMKTGTKLWLTDNSAND